MPHSTLDPATILAYRRAHYEVRGTPAMVLRVDEPSPALAAIYRATGTASAAFLTACNPEGRPLADAANARRHEALGRELRSLGLGLREGVGTSPVGDWPGEASYLVLGIERAAAMSLGRKYRQNAIVFSGPDAVPRLVLLR
jgi:hypothetical protein